MVILLLTVEALVCVTVVPPVFIIRLYKYPVPSISISVLLSVFTSIVFEFAVNVPS